MRLLVYCFKENDPSLRTNTPPLFPVNSILDILNQPVMGVAGSPFSQITDLSRVTSAAVQGSGDAPPLDPPPSVLFVNGKHEVV